MKKVLWILLVGLLIPFVMVGAVIYAVTSVLELLSRTIKLGLGYGMLWIDKNITPHIP